MRSVRTKLIVLFVVVMTLTLGSFGVYAQFRLLNELETRFAQMKEGTVSRLKINLPVPLFNFDLENIEQIIRSEMPPLEVRAIYVLSSQDRVMAGILRGQDNALRPSKVMTEAQGEPMFADIYRVSPTTGVAPSGLAEGRVVVYFSRDLINRALLSDIARRMGEVLLVDLLLVLVLTLSLRMVFGPLGQLRDALFDLARHDTEDAEELPDIQTQEFSEVIKGFNQTQRKLKQVIRRRSAAESEARAAAARTAEAIVLLKSTQSELIKAGRLAALGRLVAGIAHQLNTPIGNSIMAISVLSDRLKEFQAITSEKGLSRSRFEAFLVSINTAIDLATRGLARSASLVASFKQIAVDQTTFQRQVFDLKQLVSESLVILHPMLAVTPYQVEISIDEGLRMDSYPEPLQQVLSHIITNAVIHGFEGRKQGLIHIQAQASGKDFLILLIRDDGVGIAEENLARIFDPFFTTKLGQGDSGLGLYIVHNTVEQILGGKVDVSSRIGEGTEFKLTLPLLSSETSAE
ncbi:MAG: HAMP domain-containing histidine kinase [Rhodoferax sp.]|nr:HAMP domain-containing histidine kinase [Rhodoferax sp.]